MFRSAATKLAHNSTLPSLAGNKDLRPLQDLIIAEKGVVQSLQRLSNDLVKASDCLRSWGLGEGEDLGDTLSAATTLLGHFAAALTQYAAHELSIREYMKAVRSREENLDELRRRRKNVAGKADSAEKKLNKMSPEHKSLQAQSELLNSLRDQIKNLDWEILTEEARLGDFKRSSTKNWMLLKFGGLLECAEKATIVAEMGKLVVEEIPIVYTQPGQGRPFYSGHEKTQKYVAEAERCVSEIVFDPQPIQPVGGAQSGEPQASHSYQRDSSGSGPGLPSVGLPEPHWPYAPPLEGLPSTASASDYNRRRSSGSGHLAQQFSQDPSFGSHGRERDQQLSSPVDEWGYRDSGERHFGTMPPPSSGGPPRLDEQQQQQHFSTFSAGHREPLSPSRFSGNSDGSAHPTLPAGFPTRKSSLAGLSASANQQPSSPPPPPPMPPMPSTQAASSMSGAGKPGFRLLDEDTALAPGLSFSASLSEEIESALAGATSRESNANASAVPNAPAPEYTPPSWSHGIGMSSSGLPKGAAPPIAPHPHTPQLTPLVAGPPYSERLQEPGPATSQHLRKPSENGSYFSDDDTQLAYARDTFDAESHRDSPNRVHFGEAAVIPDNVPEDVQDEREPEDVSEATHQAHAPPPPPPPIINAPSTNPSIEGSRPQQGSPPRHDESTDERSLNASAARDIQREIDSLNLNPPPPQPPIARTPSPLAPPAPLFAQAQNRSSEVPYPTAPPAGSPYSSPISQTPRGSRLDVTTRSLPDAPASPSTASPLSPSSTHSTSLAQPRPTLGGLGLPSSAGSFASAASSSYATPPEFPGGGVPPSLRSVSPGSPSSTVRPTPPPVGTRTISAAAFKRPAMRSASSGLDSIPVESRLPMKKSFPGLPSSPRPVPPSSESDASTTTVATATPPPPPSSRGPLPQTPDQQLRSSVASSDSGQYATYDLVDSYADTDGSPVQQDYGRLGAQRVTNGSPGYGQGKFSTNLEELR